MLLYYIVGNLPRCRECRRRDKVEQNQPENNNMEISKYIRNINLHYTVRIVILSVD